MIRDELLSAGSADGVAGEAASARWKRCGLEPDDVLGKYPHQLSGGQLQRLLIARALLLEIEFLVADEIISMLDASTRIDVLNLLGDLKERGLGILFVTHDLSLGNYISDRTVILRHGVVVERGETEKVFGDPVHPYTQMLLASVPQLDRTWTSNGGPHARTARSRRATSSRSSPGTGSQRARACGSCRRGGPCPAGRLSR